MEYFDTEFLIQEVEKRPAIWDMQSEVYSNKLMKKQSWHELVELFADPDDSIEKKTILSIIIQKKWKNLRDAYIKEFKKNKNAQPGTNGQKSTTYIYYKKLSFLHNCLENREIQMKQSIYNQESDEDSSCTQNEGEIGPVAKRRKKLDKETIASTSSREQDDDDKMFCLSLYKELIKVPESKRLKTKIELLNVLEKAQTWKEDQSD